MVAIVVFLSCRAATIAASMAVLRPGSDRPAAARPAAKRRTAADGFFVPRGMPPLGGRGKKPAEPLREGDRGAAVPRALIRPFEVAWDAPVNGPMETNMTAAMLDGQGLGIADRIKTCARASTPKKARPGE